MATFLSIRKRVNYLLGESNYGTKVENAIINDHILAAVDDIVRMHPYTWNIKKASLALSATMITALPADFLANWAFEDVRITGTSASTNDDIVFTKIAIPEKDQYGYYDYVYWTTYNTDTSAYSLNTNTSAGTTSIHYYFKPTEMANDTDNCIIPDGEAVAYLAASKMWIGDEKVNNLAQSYEQKAIQRIETMYQQDKLNKSKVKTALKDIKENK